MPSEGAFFKKEDFFSVLYHELVHSTAHSTRLNRKGANGTDGNWTSFGSDAYSVEELVAEMGASYLCSQAGIVDRTINSSASHINAWLERLRGDNRLVIMAAAKAQNAVDFILNRSQQDQPAVGEMKMAA